MTNIKIIPSQLINQQDNSPSSSSHHKPNYQELYDKLLKDFHQLQQLNRQRQYQIHRLNIEIMYLNHQIEELRANQNKLRYIIRQNDIKNHEVQPHQTFSSQIMSKIDLQEFDLRIVQISQVKVQKIQAYNYGYLHHFPSPQQSTIEMVQISQICNDENDQIKQNHEAKHIHQSY